MNNRLGKSKRWKPNNRGIYWTVRYGYVADKYISTWDSWNNNSKNILLYEKGDVYKTQKEAEEACRILNIIEDNKMTRDEIDEWINNNQRSDITSDITDVFKLVLNTEGGIVIITDEDIFLHTNVDYFKDIEKAKKVVNECGKESLIKYYFKVI